MYHRRVTKSMTTFHPDPILRMRAALERYRSLKHGVYRGATGGNPTEVRIGQVWKFKDRFSWEVTSENKKGTKVTLSHVGKVYPPMEDIAKKDIARSNNWELVSGSGGEPAPEPELPSPRLISQRSSSRLYEDSSDDEYDVTVMSPSPPSSPRRSRAPSPQPSPQRSRSPSPQPPPQGQFLVPRPYSTSLYLSQYCRNGNAHVLLASDNAAPPHRCIRVPISLSDPLMLRCTVCKSVFEVRRENADIAQETNMEWPFSEVLKPPDTTANGNNMCWVNSAMYLMSAHGIQLTARRSEEAHAKFDEFHKSLSGPGSNWGGAAWTTACNLVADVMGLSKREKTSLCNGRKHHEAQKTLGAYEEVYDTTLSSIVGNRLYQMRAEQEQEGTTKTREHGDTVYQRIGDVWYSGDLSEYAVTNGIDVRYKKLTRHTQYAGTASGGRLGDFIEDLATFEMGYAELTPGALEPKEHHVRSHLLGFVCPGSEMPATSGANSNHEAVHFFTVIRVGWDQWRIFDAMKKSALSEEMYSTKEIDEKYTPKDARNMRFVQCLYIEDGALRRMSSGP